MKTFLAVVLIALFASIPSPVCAQKAPAPRYAPSSDRVTDLKQAAPMLQEFAGRYAISDFNYTTAVSVEGTLVVTDEKIALVLDKQYLDSAGIVSLDQTQPFAFDYIAVAKDAVDSGALFTLYLTYEQDDEVISLIFRVYPNGRFVGLTKTNTGEEYVLFGDRVTDDASWKAFLLSSSKLWINVMQQSPDTAFAWGRGQYVPATINTFNGRSKT